MRRIIAADAIDAAHRKAALLADDRNHRLRQRKERRHGLGGVLCFRARSGKRQSGGGAGKRGAAVDRRCHASSQSVSPRKTRMKPISSVSATAAPMPATTPAARQSADARSFFIFSSLKIWQLSLFSGL